MTQDEDFLSAAGAVHPAMVAFGLWKERTDLEDLSGELDNHRQQAPRRPDPKL